MTPTPLTRTARALALAAAAAVLILTAPGLARAVNTAAGDGGSAIPDWPERYAIAHPYGEGTPYAVTGDVVDGRSPDTLDAAGSAHSIGIAPVSGIRDGRSPDTLAAALAAHSTDGVTTSSFDWGDMGIGVALGAGVSIAMLCCLAGLLFVRRRHQAQAV